MPRAVLLGALLSILIAGVGMVSTVAGQDALLGACSVRGEVLTSFDLPAARAFGTRFPAALAVPELDVDKPARVYVFAGAVDVFTIGRLGTLPATRLTNVVCVVMGGVANVYYDVDLTGFQP